MIHRWPTVLFTFIIIIHIWIIIGDMYWKIPDELKTIATCKSKAHKAKDGEQNVNKI